MRLKADLPSSGRRLSSMLKMACRRVLAYSFRLLARIAKSRIVCGHCCTFLQLRRNAFVADQIQVHNCFVHLDFAIHLDWHVGEGMDARYKYK